MAAGHEDGVRIKLSPLVTLLDTAIILERGIERQMSEIGLTLAQQRLLTFLYISREKLSPSLLGALLLQKSHSVSSLLGGLEKKNMVERRYDPRDRRQVWVELLPEGRRAAEKALEVELPIFAKFESILAAPGATGFVETLRAIREIATTLADYPEELRREASSRVFGGLKVEGNQEVAARTKRARSAR